MVVSAAPDAQRSRFSTVIDHDLIVCGRFLPGEASQRQDNVLYLIYNKQGSALASNWWGKASFHSRIFLSVLQLLRSFLFSFFTPSLTQTFVSDFLLPDSAVLMPNQHLELVFLAVVWAHLWNWTLVLKYNSLMVANIVAFVIQTATWLTARVLLQACYTRCMCIPSTVHGESGTVV